MIDAMLHGILTAAQSSLGIVETASGIRYGGNGKPMAAYQGGGWYYGFYFKGLQTWDAQAELYAVNYTAGIDVTRILAQVPTAQRGNWITDPGELYHQAQLLHQMMLAADNKITNYCNQELANRYDISSIPNCAFMENFDTGSIDAERMENGEWIAAESETDVPTILVMSMSFSGLKYMQPLERTPLA